jgi:FtsH-binding integral membrane protein
MTRSDVVEWVWQRQSVWSQAANRLRTRITSARRAACILTVGVAAASLASSQLKPKSLAVAVVLSVLAAVAAAGLTVLAAAQAPDRVSRWTRARSVAEALKAEVHMYLAGTGRYAAPQPDQTLMSEARRVINTAGDIGDVIEGLRPVARPLPPIHNLDSYLDVRVRESQLDNYYRRRSRALRERLRWSKAMIIVLTLLAAAFAAVAAVSPVVAAWAAVITTAVGATAAYVAGERWEFLQVEYSRTAQELDRLLATHTDETGAPLNADQLVNRCEDVISVQNQAWMAKWGGTPE